MEPLKIHNVFERLSQFETERAGLSHFETEMRLAAPPYQDEIGQQPNLKLLFAVDSFRRHMTDEGHQLQRGLALGGYRLVGVPCDPAESTSIDTPENNVREAVESAELDGNRLVSTVIMQDKREWDAKRTGCFDPKAEFQESSHLATRPDIFRLTVLKDAHQDPLYHREAANEIGCHAWITYYHPRIVSRLAKYVRPKHLVRTWHTINPEDVPEFSPNKSRILLSGASSKKYYPLRYRMRRYINFLPFAQLLNHPGYGVGHCHTPGYLATLARYRAAICTASIFGYSLRKIIEATACGCVVITDLPVDDVIPEIDDNLVRIHPEIPINELAGLLEEVHGTYNAERQRHFAELAIKRFDYRVEGFRLSCEIENLRTHYAASHDNT